MPTAKQRTTERISRRQVDKFTERRAELAQAALETLADLGYARTSLREIANNSQFSHGVVHYYFSDKTELIVYCVKYYKAQCVRRYDGVVADSTSPRELLDAFAAKLVETLQDEAPMHRLWYDLRTQSMFEEPLREAVTMIDKTLEDMIWRVVARYAELSDREVAILREVALGRGNREIGVQLGLSEETIKANLKCIFAKLEVADRTHAVTTALARGILDP